MTTPKEVKELIESAGGKINEIGVMPDGSGFATASFPLPKTHWIYAADRHEDYGDFNVPPMPLRLGSNECIRIDTPRIHDTLDRKRMAEIIRAAGKYAVRSATMNGKEMDFDPDALLQNLVVGFLGYWTGNGLSDDEWENPK